MLYSKKLSHFKNLIHGFTTREEGDLKQLRETTRNGQIILRTEATAHIGDICNLKDLVLPEQIHGDKIALVGKKERGKIMKGTDGLITQEKEVFLGVTTADCVPILFYEPKKKIIAVAHAGWKGTLKRICQKVVEKIKGLGGNLEYVLVALGPHIKKCCYDIDKKRALMFKKKFGGEVIIKKGGSFFLDLTRMNINQLLEKGVRKENTEVLPFCTHCDSNLFRVREASPLRRRKRAGKKPSPEQKPLSVALGEASFFSYRRDKESCGGMLSFIGRF